MFIYVLKISINEEGGAYVPLPTSIKNAIWKAFMKGEVLFKVSSFIFSKVSCLYIFSQILLGSGR